MAINPETSFPGKITASSAEYPFGKARNITIPGDGTGTPWDQLILNDIFGFQQALLSEAGLVPTGAPDEVGASQYLKAMRKIGVTTFNTIALMTVALKASLSSNQQVAVGGYNSLGDGGGGEFFFDEASTDTVNGGTIFITDEGGAGRWKRIHKNILTLKDFGVKTDGSFMEVEVQSAVDVCSANGFFLEGIDGAVTLDDTVNLKSGLLMIGTGKTSSKFVASATLGVKNLFSAVVQNNITFSQFGTDMRNDITLGAGNDFLENALFFEDCSDIRVHNNSFTRDLMHSVMVRGLTLPGDSTNIFIHDNDFTDGARGGIDIRRFGKNIHIFRNTMTNVIDSSKSVGGVDFEKPIVVTGSVDCYMHHNNILQTNGEGGPLIYEFLTVACSNVYMYENSYTGAEGIGGGAYKVGDCIGVHLFKNKAISPFGTGIFIGGCTDAWIHENDLEDCGKNSIIITSDINVPTNIHVYKNLSKNPNQNGAALGTPGADGSDESSYHILFKGGGDHIYCHENVMRDTSVIANGIKLNQDEAYLWGNDFTGIANGSPSSIIAVNNRFMDPLTQTYRIWDNPGFPTIDKGKADITTGNTLVIVSPNVVANGLSGAGYKSVTLDSAMNGTQAYFYLSDSTNADFQINLRTASHGAPTNTGTVQFLYERDISRVVDGALAGI